MYVLPKQVLHLWRTRVRGKENRLEDFARQEFTGNLQYLGAWAV